jgi:hypothetical protein
MGVLPRHLAPHLWTPLCFAGGCGIMDRFAAECGFGWGAEEGLPPSHG